MKKIYIFSSYAFLVSIWLLSITTLVVAIRYVSGYHIIYHSQYGISYDWIQWSLRKLTHIGWLGIPFFGCIYLWCVTRRVIGKTWKQRLPVIQSRGMISFGRKGQWLLIGLVVVTFLISAISIFSRYRIGLFFIEFRFWNADMLFLPLLFICLSLCSLRYVMTLYVRSKLIDLRPVRFADTTITLLLAGSIEGLFLLSSWLGSWMLLPLSISEVLLALQLIPVFRYLAKLNSQLESI